MERIRHAEDILKSNEGQFEKYKEVCNKKIDIQSQSLEQKFEKFKNMVAQFNEKFKPIIEKNEE